MEEIRDLGQLSTTEPAQENGVVPTIAVGDAPKVKKQRSLSVATVAYEKESVKPNPEGTVGKDKKPAPLLRAEGLGIPTGLCFLASGCNQTCSLPPIGGTRRY